MRKMMLGVLLLAAACGDPKTNDHRGYTKAPLERPTVLVKGEPKTEMAGLGSPILPAAPVIEPEDEAAAKKAGAPAPAAKAGGAAPAGATAADVGEGEKIFTGTGNCFTCHGQGGTGTAMAPALNDKKWLHIKGEWAEIQNLVHTGVPKPMEHPAPMPPMGGAQLTDAQVKQVAAYVYSLSH
ncbi:MAG TPA: c-type cytochrome [Longimicrobiales bacterium]|nr:c-type cytochrome [Longimicrobiales bacterium]